MSELWDLDRSIKPINMSKDHCSTCNLSNNGCLIDTLLKYDCSTGYWIFDFYQPTPIFTLFLLKLYYFYNKLSTRSPLLPSNLTRQWTKQQQQKKQRGVWALWNLLACPRQREKESLISSPSSSLIPVARRRWWEGEGSGSIAPPSYSSLVGLVS